MGYDSLYQDWLTAKQAGDYAKADHIRDEFERLHGLTIFAEGDMPIEGVTTTRMTLAAWTKKYGDGAKLAAIHRSDGIYKMPLMARGSYYGV